MANETPETRLAQLETVSVTLIDELETRCKKLEEKLERMCALFDASQADMRTLCTSIVAKSARESEERMQLEARIEKMKQYMIDFYKAVYQMDRNLVDKDNALAKMIFETNKVLAKTGEGVIYLYRQMALSPEIAQAASWIEQCFVPCTGALACSACLTRMYQNEPGGSTLPLREEEIVVAQNIESALTKAGIVASTDVEEEARCDHCKRRGTFDGPGAFFVRNYDIRIKKRSALDDEPRRAFKRVAQ